MRRLLTVIAGGFGLAALWGLLRRRPALEQPTVDPAEELRRRLAEARETDDDRDEFDAAEGTPVDEVEEPRSIEERRRAVHEQAEKALGHMQQRDAED